MEQNKFFDRRFKGGEKVISGSVHKVRAQGTDNVDEEANKIHQNSEDLRNICCSGAIAPRIEEASELPVAHLEEVLLPGAARLHLHVGNGVATRGVLDRQVVRAPHLDRLVCPHHLLRGLLLQ